MPSMPSGRSVTTMRITLFPLAIVLAAAFGSHAPACAQSRPNIVVIYTDDQGYGDMSALNPDSKFQTPHLGQTGLCEGYIARGRSAIGPTQENDFAIALPEADGNATSRRKSEAKCNPRAEGAAGFRSERARRLEIA